MAVELDVNLGIKSVFGTFARYCFVSTRLPVWYRA